MFTGSKMIKRMERDLKEIISEILDNKEDYFGDDELAYFCLTGKFEEHLRDRLAWAITEETQDEEGLMALKESSKDRIDLSVKDKESGEDIILVECKQMFTFDGIKDPEEFPKKMKEDLKKMKNKDKEMFLILSAIHPKERVESWIKEELSYTGKINSYLKKRKDVYEDCKENTEKQHLFQYCKRRNKYYHKKIDAGSFSDISVDLCFWVLGPINKQEAEEILSK